ncbi:immunity 50 family protein [Variovorax boronicumulans]|uniref:immunity 50 family protein n=1 Tax=Variovorax boronicumulans TaxID=436515 RepID=UPI00339209E0
MNDYQKILNPQAVLALYGNFSPLSDSEVLEILLKRDEPRVSIKLMTEKKPVNPPARWAEAYDVIYLGISFLGVRNLVAAGWDHKNSVNQISIQTSNGLVSVHIYCIEGFSMIFDCEWISIDSLVPGNIGTA